MNRASILSNLLLEGNSVMSSIQALTEATIDANAKDKWERSSFYKSAHRGAKQILIDVENPDEFRKEELAVDPEAAFQRDLDNLEYTVGMLTGVSLKNFDAAQISAANKVLNTAQKRLKNASKRAEEFKQDVELATKHYKPLEYSKDALTAFLNYFKALGLPWDIDHTWQNYLNDSDPGNTKNPAAKDAYGRRKVDYMVPESRRMKCSRRITESADCEDFEQIEGTDTKSCYGLLNKHGDTSYICQRCPLWGGFEYQDMMGEGKKRNGRRKG